jgi:acetyl esterase/lipase
MKRFRMLGSILIAVTALIAPARAEDKPTPSTTQPAFRRQIDVIYGRLPGVALTMDVFTPAEGAKHKPNGAGVIWVVSGGWASAHEVIEAKSPLGSLQDQFIKPLCDRGYTVFAVVHGSQPKYTIPEILPQLNRAVRFIRFHAKDYGIDGDRLGIVGASAGGHLSLMQGISPEPPNDKSLDEVDRTSSKVQAVAAFVPPTDFLNYGKEGVNALGTGPLGWLKAPFDFVEGKQIENSAFPGGKQVVYERVTDEKRRDEIGKYISPIYHVDAADAPTLIFHGEIDPLVPLQQVQSLKAKLDEAKVPNELIVKPKAGHGWPGMGDDMQKAADWFDKYLTPADKK